MIVLDENIPESQVQLLRRARLRVQQIGIDLGRKSMTDRDIIPLLLAINRPTFFTQDSGFFHRRLCHRRYCLVHLACADNETAFYTRRFIRHPTFKTRAMRMGKVIKVLKSGLSYWHAGAPTKVRILW